MSAILPGHGLPPTGLGGINLQPQGNVQVPQGQQQAPQGVGPARQGAGALAGRQIQVGDGQPRDTSLGLADKARNFFKTGAKVLAGIVLAPVMAVIGTDFSSFTKPGMSRGLVIRWLCAPNFMNTRQFAVNAKMWYSGSAVTISSSPRRTLVPTQAAACCMLATMLRWVSIAPLETPVVPPVYCRKARSSAAFFTSGNWCMRPRVRVSRKRTAPGMS